MNDSVKFIYRSQSDRDNLVKALKEFFKFEKNVDMYDEPNPTINAIFIDYLAFLLLCNLDKDTKKAVEDDPRTLLEYVPDLKIPDYVSIELDPNDRKWPTAVFEKLLPEKKPTNDNVKKTEQYEYHEFYESANEVKSSYCKGGKLSPAKIHSHKPKLGDLVGLEVKDILDKRCKAEVNMNKGECTRTIIKLPFFTPETDLLTEYKFKNQEECEIVLTTCC